MDIRDDLNSNENGEQLMDLLDGIDIEEIEDIACSIYTSPAEEEELTESLAALKATVDRIKAAHAARR